MCTENNNLHASHSETLIQFTTVISSPRLGDKTEMCITQPQKVQSATSSHDLIRSHNARGMEAFKLNTGAQGNGSDSGGVAVLCCTRSGPPLRFYSLSSLLLPTIS